MSENGQQKGGLDSVAADCRHHLDVLRGALVRFESHFQRLDAWGAELARRLPAGARLLTAGNGGSAAHAEHLACEFVGRYQQDRRPFSALALHVDGSALTALVNDYGPQQMFARQVVAHTRAGDVVLLLSTSGRSFNVVAAAGAGRDAGAAVWSLTGPAPNPLADASDENLAVDAPATATIQEVHQVAIHLLCASFDRHRSPEDGG